jgi:nuclear pore complex protein Nup133
MFSASNGAAPANGEAKKSRRRPRPHSNENFAVQPRAKRQRSSINGQTFASPHDGEPEMQDTFKSTRASVARRESNREIHPRRELAVRGKKSKVVDRPIKGDGGTVLV